MASQDCIRPLLALGPSTGSNKAFLLLNINTPAWQLVQVSAQVKPLIDSLRALHHTCASAPQMQAPVKKREMDDNSKKMGQLFWKLNAG